MKGLQSFLLKTSITAGIFAATLLGSCDKCKNHQCENGGVCRTDKSGRSWGGGDRKVAICDCPAGFESDDIFSQANCKIESRVKLFGNYLLSGSDNMSGTYSNKNTSIVISPLSKTKFILDVNGIFNLTCSMSSSTTFVVDNATISGYTFSGSREYTYTGNSLSLSVTKTDGTDNIFYTLSGTKQ